MKPPRRGTKEEREWENAHNVAYPAAEALSLRVALGACRISARPGEGEAWVAGICYDPSDKCSPRVMEERGSVTITEAEPSFERIPAVFGVFPLRARVRQAKILRAHHRDRRERVRPRPGRRAPEPIGSEAGGGQV